jgi:hypothetical protein
MTAPRTDPHNPGVALPPDRIKEPGAPEPIVDPEVDVPPDDDAPESEPVAPENGLRPREGVHTEIDPSRIFAPPGLGVVWQRRKTP